VNEPPQPAAPQPGQQASGGAPPPWAPGPPGAPTPPPAPPDAGPGLGPQASSPGPQSPPPPPTPGTGQAAASQYPPPPGQAPPPPGQAPPPYQGYPPPLPGYAGYPPYGQPGELQRVKNQRTVLLVVLAVIGLVALSTFAACAQACIGCHASLHASTWKVVTWGWDQGAGPGYIEVQNSYVIGTPAARDKLPADPAKDAQARAGLLRIWKGVQAYRRGHHETSTAVGPLYEYLRQHVTPWPTNPWTGQDMEIGNHRGDYLYQDYGDGTYDLYVYLSSAGG